MKEMTSLIVVPVDVKRCEVTGAEEKEEII
jgi:hypothetical protein